LLGELARQKQREILSHSARSAEARLKVALESTDEGILMVSSEGTLLSFNKRFLELWHVPVELAAAGQDAPLLAHVLDQLANPDSFLEQVRRLYGSDAEATDTLVFKDGRVFERYSRALSMGDEQGRIWCFRDVSAQAHTREALAEREEQYRAIVNQAGDGIDLIDAETLRFLEVNEAACRMLGYRRDELVGQPLAMIQGWRDEAALREAVAEVVREGQAGFENRHRCKDGRLLDVYVNTRAIRLHGRTCLVGVWRDIGGRKAAELALKESRNLLQTVIDTAPMRVFWKDRDLRYLGCNPAFARDAGKNHPDELLGKDDFQMGWAEQAELYRADDRAVMASGVSRLSYDEPQTRPDGQTIWLRTSKVPLLDSDHQAIGILGVYEDITERKLAEIALGQREEYQRAVLDNFPFMVWLKDEESRFLAVNKAFAIGCDQSSPESLVGKTDLDIWPRDLADSYRADDRSVLESGVARQVEEIVEIEGGRRWYETYKSPVAIDGRIMGTVGFARDITERKEAERNLKMAVEVTQVILWRVDFPSQKLSFDPAMLPVLGMEADESFADMRDWIQRVHPDDTKPFMLQFQTALRPGESSFDMEYRLRQRDGGYQWIHTKGSVIQRDAEGLPEVAVGTSMNITERKLAEKVLLESEERLRAIFDVANAGLSITDRNGRYVMANERWAATLGYSQEEILALTYEDVTHPDDLEVARENFRRLIEGNLDRYRLEKRYTRKDGAVIWADLSVSSIKDSDSRVTHVVGMLVDITSRKQAEAELERHRLHLEELVQQRTGELLATEARAMRILESAADGLYGVDSESRITFINPAACRMLGCTVEQAMGRSAHELFHHSHPDGSPYPAAECLARQAWRAGRESRIDDETYWHADGHAVPVTLASRPIIENEKIVGAVVSVVDVSHQRAAAQAREQALVAAENLARARSEFLANMSHEIRTPMNGVLGFAQIGQRNHKDPEKARNAFEKILTSGNQLLGVVNEILDFSKIDAGKLQVDAGEMVLGDVLGHALELVADRARAKGLDLKLEKAPGLPPACVGDALRLGQVLLNLLTNAVKFTEAGGVTLSASRQGDQLVFGVSDTGIGMTAEQLGYVFNPFQQADGSTTRKFGGTGLGLAICKRLIELMKGEIRVESNPGVGSLFEVRLPYVQPVPHPETVEATPAALPRKPLAGISILLAEDDEINRMMLQVNLEDDGARLVMVGDGQAAVARVVGDGPAAYDIVLMDIQMPEMDGYEATRRILEVAPGLPVIGQTAHAFEEDRDKCLAAGMVAHIAKPIDPQALVKLVLRVLAGERQR
jgi:PAS domain S-box-containing protein